MAFSRAAKSEGHLALHYSLVAGVGLVTDGCVLTLLEHFGMEPAWARVFSLASAMQVTFWINGLWVFRCLTRRGWVPAWLGYMATSGFGNFCNYFAFVGLVSLHSPLWSNRWLDLTLGGILAWSINYACARLLVFGARRERAADAPDKHCTPISAVLEGISTRLKGVAPGATGPAQR